jgi:hypothetical protein
MQRNLAESASKVQQLVSALAVLKAQLLRLKRTETETQGDEYVENFCNFK